MEMFFLATLKRVMGKRIADALEGILSIPFLVASWMVERNLIVMRGNA
jgi:hypothetical protein